MMCWQQHHLEGFQRARLNEVNQLSHKKDRVRINSA
jgi:hypothetical protein